MIPMWWNFSATVSYNWWPPTAGRVRWRAVCTQESPACHWRIAISYTRRIGCTNGARMTETIAGPRGGSDFLMKKWLQNPVKKPVFSAGLVGGFNPYAKYYMQNITVVNPPIICEYWGKSTNMFKTTNQIMAFHDCLPPGFGASCFERLISW